MASHGYACASRATQAMNGGGFGSWWIAGIHKITGITCLGSMHSDPCSIGPGSSVGPSKPSLRKGSSVQMKGNRTVCSGVLRIA